MDIIIQHFNGNPEPILSFLDPKDFVNFASIGKKYLEFTHKYFSSFSKNVIHTPTLFYKSDEKIIKSFLLKVKMQYFKQSGSIGILKPVSIKYSRSHHFSCYGWIISCNEMPKTGEKFRPFPYKIDGWNNDNPIIKAIPYKDF